MADSRVSDDFHQSSPDPRVDVFTRVEQQIAVQPIAAQYISVIPLKEQGLPLQVGAIVRSESASSWLVRQFITHLHRAAHQFQ